MRVFILLFLFFLANDSFTQISGIQSYQTQNNTSYPYLMHLQNGDYVLGIARANNSDDFKESVRITKFDDCHGILWSNEYQINSYPTQIVDIIEDPNDHSFHIFLISPNPQTSYHLNWVHLDTDGAVLDSKLYLFNQEAFRYAYNAELIDNKLVVFCKTGPAAGNNFISLLKFSLDGNYLDGFQLYDSYTGLEVSKTIDDKVFIHSGKTILETDIDGNLSWAKELKTFMISSSFYPTVYHQGFSYFTTFKLGYCSISQVNSEGKILWTSPKIPSTTYPLLKKSKNGSVILQTYQTVNGNQYPQFIEFNKEGTILRNFTLDMPYQMLGFHGFNRHYTQTTDMVFSASYNNQSYIYHARNIENEQCQLPLDLLNLEDPIEDLSTTDLPLDIKKEVLLKEALPVNVVFEPSSLEEGVICATTIPEDSMKETSFLYCHEFYTYSDHLINAKYEWQDNFSKDKHRVINDSGIYELHIKTCNRNIIKTIDLQSTCDCEIFIPNSFTPNEDQINDLWTIISGCELATLSFQIYDRWGKLVYQNANKSNVWNGQDLQGNSMETGTYLYQLSYSLKSSVNNLDRIHKSGVLSLLK
ncbi:MAG: gliding motility-associated C-terminal domain-containing protein [Flavobacteriales bacterium]|jgi:gliding motility-associated-like protein|nr:gliding motility-associated C-terminal domain-containing protein [Flavobacteriales bacterium]